MSSVMSTESMVTGCFYKSTVKSVPHHCPRAVGCQPHKEATGSGERRPFRLDLERSAPASLRFAVLLTEAQCFALGQSILLLCCLHRCASLCFVALRFASERWLLNQSALPWLEAPLHRALRYPCNREEGARGRAGHLRHPKVKAVQADSRSSNACE